MEDSRFPAMCDAKSQQLLRPVSKLESVVFSFIDPFAFKVVLDLGIPDILQRAGGVLTLQKIAEQLPSRTVQLEWLYRIMRFNVVNEIFTEPTVSDVELEIGERQFGLTLVSTLLVEDNNPLCPVHMLIAPLNRSTFQPWFRLSEAVLSGTDPCRLEYGKSSWEWFQDKPELADIFNKGMACDSRQNVPPIVKGYKGFKGMKQLVDVGGGTGTTLAIITQAYPEIEAINYDLPRVVDGAPVIPGVKHVGGDMFESVPRGEAILMKLILHDWGDKECISILQNCYKSLPENGKVILIETVLADVQDAIHQPTLRRGYYLDLFMLTKMKGRERSFNEWHKLLNVSGFKRVEIIAYPPCPLQTIEGSKF